MRNRFEVYEPRNLEVRAPQKKFRRPSALVTQTLASNLRNLRRKLDLSQEELAEQCGLHRTYVGSVERGERNVTLSSLETLASALGVSVPQLLSQDPNDK